MKYREGVSKASIKGKGLVSAVDTNAQFGVLSDAFLKEVYFALTTNHFHPLKRVPNVEVMVAPKAEEEAVGAEFDVVAHHSRVHSDQFNGEGINNEFHLNCNCTANDLNNLGFQKPVDKFRE
jgi:hypothetical protein